MPIIIILIVFLSAHDGNSQHRGTDTTHSVLNQYYKKYTMAMKWNDVFVARDALYDMIIKNPQSDSLVLSLAYLYYENQQYTSAALIGQQLLERYPKNIIYLRLSSASLEAIGALDKALQNYETLYLLSDDTKALYKVTLLQYQLNKNTEGLNNVNILLNRTDVKTIQISINTSKGLPQKYPMEVGVLNLQGMFYEKIKTPEKAREAYKKALHLSPNFTPAKDNLTKIKSKKK